MSTISVRNEDREVPMGPVDRFFVSGLGGQVTDETTMYIGGIVRIPGTPPGVGDLRRLVAAQARRVPVLSYRVNREKRAWTVCDGFTPGDHVVECRLPPGADVAAQALELMAQPFPADRPPWRLALIHGYPEAGEEEQYTLCYAADHAFQDGMSISATVHALFGGGALPVPRADEYFTAIRPRRWPAPSDLAVPLRRVPVLEQLRGPFTGRREMLTFRFDQDALNATAKVTGATRNQVCLAALTGALRDWAPAEWAAPVGPGRRRGLPVAVPLSLRAGRGSGCLGNQVTGLHIHLPCHRPSPVEQLDRIVAQTNMERLQRHRELHRALLPRLPYAAVRPLLARLFDPRYTAMFITTVRMGPLRLGDLPIRDVWGIPPLLPTQPLMIVLFQYRDGIMPSLLFDTAVPGCDRLAELWSRHVGVLHDAVTAPSPSPDGRPRTDEPPEESPWI
ncbi:wax ester/triacylglycerol synthase domain-containing protein [Nonomuraea sp. NPDC049725]|uniref:wax ester/triacylglycerol synthase domain-containing protein n=1 Tax=Nonomuraea sp. NPDC049725 TaxID=3154508 RepID=UPI0034177283